MEFKVGVQSPLVERLVGTKALYHLNQVSIDDVVTIGKPIVALIDADIVAYRSSATCDGRQYSIDGKTFNYKKDAVKYCQENKLDRKDIDLKYTPSGSLEVYDSLNSCMKGIRDKLKAERLESYLTPEILFRHDYMPDYKKNREGKRKPANLQVAKKYLESKYLAEQVDGYEADDLIGIRAIQLMAEGEVTPIICSLDKDLDMIPGYHYNWTKRCLYFITPEEGTLNFYKQLLVGDTVDNIPGIHGVGNRTAEKILEGLDGKSSCDCYAKVLHAYIERSTPEEGESPEDFHKRIVQTITRNARLLYIVRHQGEVWIPPVQVTEDN